MAVRDAKGAVGSTRSRADIELPDARPSEAGEQDAAYAVIAFRQDGLWQVGELPDALTDDLEGLIAAVRQQPGENGAFALVDVADEFFVVVRVQLGRVRLLLSDVSAASDWDLAEQVIDYLDVELPQGEELDELWPAGDLGLFADMGLDAVEMAELLADDDAYADELLSVLAERLGFANDFERVVDALVG